MTLAFIFFAGCSNTSKEEEVLDTLLLVARNVLQFGRLASVMRQYVLPVPLIHGTCSLTLTLGYKGPVNPSSRDQNPLTSRPLAEDILLISIWKATRTEMSSGGLLSVIPWSLMLPRSSGAHLAFRCPICLELRRQFKNEIQRMYGQNLADATRTVECL